MLASRAGLSFLGSRDLYKALGYDRQLTYQGFVERYARDGLASRIVDAYAQATWSTPPAVVEDEDEARERTEFEQAFLELAKRLQLWDRLTRVDKLAGLGRYAVLFIGLNDGRATDLEAGKVKDAGRVLYLSVFGEGSARIKEVETRTDQARYGLPMQYELDTGISIGSTTKSSKQNVHASRVLHVAENLLEDDVQGTPRLQRVWNLLDDLAKAVGGSAEAFWKIADRGIAFELDPAAKVDDTVIAAMKDQIEAFYHEQRRYLTLQGAKANVLGGGSVNPAGVAEIVLSLIAGTTGIPKRILLGSERGELASSQDQRSWNERVDERARTWAEPMVLRELIDRLIGIGALPAPRDAYLVRWPDRFALSPSEQAEVAKRRADAVRALASQGSQAAPMTLVTQSEGREWLGLPPDMESE